MLRLSTRRVSSSLLLINASYYSFLKSIILSFPLSEIRYRNNNKLFLTTSSKYVLNGISHTQNKMEMNQDNETTPSQIIEEKENYYYCDKCKGEGIFYKKSKRKKIIVKNCVKCNGFGIYNYNDDNNVKNESNTSMIVPPVRPKNESFTVGIIGGGLGMFWSFFRQY